MAYVTPDLVDIPAAVRELSSLVPEYMVPEIIIPLKDLPSLPNGKVNRRGLPEPDFSATAQVDYNPPRNSIEEEIQYAWHEVVPCPLYLFFGRCPHGKLNMGSLKTCTTLLRLNETMRKS